MSFFLHLFWFFLLQKQASLKLVWFFFQITQAWERSAFDEKCQKSKIHYNIYVFFYEILRDFLPSKRAQQPPDRNRKKNTKELGARQPVISHWKIVLFYFFYKKYIFFVPILIFFENNGHESSLFLTNNVQNTKKIYYWSLFLHFLSFFS